MPVAEAERSTLGRAFIFARALTRERVVSMRLERNCALRSALQRPSAIEAPARFTTASAPTAAPPNSPVAGFHATSKPSFDSPFAVLCGRTRRQTVWPSLARERTSAVPTRPLDPVTRIFIVSLLDSFVMPLE